MAINGLEYIASYGDLIAAFGADEAAGQQHYEAVGIQEGRAVTFNGLEYIAAYDDLIQAFGANETAGAAHYIVNGSVEGRSVTFDGLQYIASYGDLIQAFGANEDAGAAHYIAAGRTEGRLRDDFSAERYLSKYDDLQAAFGGDLNAATRHYITNGFAEGRTDDRGAADPLWNNGLEILALGDSITRGSGSTDTGGYRGPLDTLFNNAGLPMDFVGRLQGGQIPDPDHEGDSFRTATSLSSEVTGIINATHPETVLLLIGTNDVLREANAASTVPGEIASIINQIHAVDSSTHVLVANLPVISPDTTFGAGVPAMRTATNAGLEQAVNLLASQGSEVSLVDTSGIALGDLVDGIQLNPTGHAKFAQAWFNAIQDAIPPPSAGIALASANELALNYDGSDIAAASAASEFIF